MELILKIQKQPNGLYQWLMCEENGNVDHWNGPYKSRPDCVRNALAFKEYSEMKGHQVKTRVEDRLRVQ